MDPAEAILRRRLTGLLAADEFPALVDMLRYLDRHSLPLARIEQDGETPVLVFGSPPCHRIAPRRLLALHERLRRGEALDWNRLS